jgi:purine-cytosine permease-like protein
MAMAMTEEEEEQLQKEHRAKRAKETRIKVITGLSLILVTGLLISASLSRDISTFLLLFGTIVSAYAVALVAAVLYDIVRRRRRLQKISQLIKLARNNK